MLYVKKDVHPFIHPWGPASYFCLGPSENGCQQTRFKGNTHENVVKQQKRKESSAEGNSRCILSLCSLCHPVCVRPGGAEIDRSGQSNTGPLAFQQSSRSLFKKNLIHSLRIIFNSVYELNPDIKDRHQLCRTAILPSWDACGGPY